MGVLRGYITDSYWRTLLLIEMCARAGKCLIRADLRDLRKKTRDSGIQIYKSCVISNLNLLLGESAESSRYWNVTLRAALLNKYTTGLNFHEISVDYDLKKSMEISGWKLAFLYKLQKMLGMKFPGKFKFLKGFNLKEVVILRISLIKKNLLISLICKKFVKQLNKFVNFSEISKNRDEHRCLGTRVCVKDKAKSSRR